MRQKVSLAFVLSIVFSALAISAAFFAKYLISKEPKLVFFEWVWPHQKAEHDVLSEFEYCHRRTKRCRMAGPRFLIGTFERSGKYVSHLRVQRALSEEEPIGLVWRLEALISPHRVAREIKSALSFFSDLKVPVEFLFIDYDSPSKRLRHYADWIRLLRSQQLQLPVSVSGLASWSFDNLDGFKALVENVETVSVQLYQGAQKVELHDNLVSALERLDNVHISLFCPDTGFLDHFFKKVSISRQLDIGIFNGSGCSNLSE